MPVSAASNASRTPSTRHPGPLALVGGGEWTEGASFDRDLLSRGSGEVLVLPTAAAYEHPQRAVEVAEAWFAELGGHASGLMVLARPDAEDGANAAAVRASRFIYLGGGSPLHLRSVLKGSAVWEALFEAWEDGAVVAGSSAGAMVLTDPMVDPRGGALTLGLGLVEQLAVIPHYGAESAERLHRTLTLAAAAVAVAGVPERTALIREPDGTWRVDGESPEDVTVFVGGRKAGFDALPG